MKKVLFISIVVGILSVAGMAHSGGTNSQGCHYDHSTGLYHCH